MSARAAIPFMRIQSPSLVELHAFLSVARTGSFRRAAQELCVTQAAVSRAVMRLEADMGQEVFLRSGSGVVLTGLGEELRRMTAEPVLALEAAVMHLRKQQHRLRLRLAVVTSLGNLWLMRRLEGFRQNHPEVEIEFRQYRHDEDFTREDVDLWIDVKRGVRQRWPRHIAARYLIGREVVAVCAPRFATQIRSATDLLHLPMLYHTSFPENWHVWAEQAHLDLTGRRLDSGFDLVINLVDAARAGMGVAIVQECMVREDLQTGRLVAPIGVRASTGRGYYLCGRKSQVAHPASDLFRKWLLDEALREESGDAKAVGMPRSAAA